MEQFFLHNSFFLFPSSISSYSLTKYGSYSFAHLPKHKSQINTHRRENIQRHLAAIVPKNDQILLVGPPYKVLKDHHLRANDTLSSLRLGDYEDDPTTPQHSSSNAQPSTDEHNTTATAAETATSATTNSSTSSSTTRRKSILLNSTEQSGSKRIFLFSKQALSEIAPDPEPCILSPQSITLPQVPDPSPIFNSQMNPNNSDNMDSIHHHQSTPSPLHQALSIYERRFMLHLCQGRTYADAADLRLTSSRNCIQEQAVMVRALRAAVSNLSDHWNNATRTRMEFTTVYIQKMEEHGKLLNNFDTLLKGLGEIELDTELKAIARVNGRVMETLLDTVPVDRMRSWAAQCQTGYANLQNLFGQLESAFEELKKLYNREYDGKADLQAEKSLLQLESEVEVSMVELADKQAGRLTKLTEDHMEVVQIVLNAMKDEGHAQAAFSVLETMTKASSDVIPSMEKDDGSLTEIMKKVADAKTNAMKRMKVRLRQISVAQNKLFKVQTFAGMQGTLRDTLNQHCEDMTHLEHLVELPASYKDFLREIQRRRAYGEAVISSTDAMMGRLGTMRNDEVKARERFVRGSGRHLMPCFFEMFVPTLATPPPLFTPQLPSAVEMDTLPNITLDDDEQPNAKSSVDFNNGAEDVSSSLTEPSILPNEEKMSSVTESVSQLSITKEKGKYKPESLIVSAEEQSGDDVIMRGENDNVAAEAQADAKALLYENKILRQALEKVGGKMVKTYLDQERLKEIESKHVSQKQVQLENELVKAKAELAQAKKEIEQMSSSKATVTKKSNVLCDKISHSSFNVGDVALFMPTGHSSAGKRTYVAFHSNCPHRFLSTDSIDGKPDYVIGRIVYQEELIAGPVGSTETNPHNLIVGTKFWILTVEVLKLGRGNK